jgi:hypothetical protein
VTVTNTGLSVHISDATLRIYGTGMKLDSTGALCVSVRVENNEVSYFGTAEQLEKLVVEFSKALSEAKQG